jgi:RimJ/RimL family protein N-acetyltransferase
VIGFTHGAAWEGDDRQGNGLAVATRRVFLVVRSLGYAPWTIVTKADARIIGWGGLYDDPFDPGWGVEIGYHFDPASWGQGYATELAAACTSLADNDLQLPEIRAFARPENVASRRVLEKAGFEVVRFVPDMARLLYRRTRQGERPAA